MFAYPESLQWTPVHHGGRAGPVPAHRDVKLAAHTALDDTQKAFGQMCLDIYRLSAEAMAELDFQGLVSGGTVNAQYLLIDFMMIRRELAITESGGKYVVEGTGSGLRMALCAIDVTADLTVDYKSFAAASELGIGRTVFDAKIVGFEASELPYLPILSGGKFGADQVEQLAESMNALVTFMANEQNWGALKPVRVKVALEELSTPTAVRQAWSAHAALEQIWRRHKWSEAHQQITRDARSGQYYVPVISRMVYQALGVDGTPKDNNANLAGELLWQGR